MRSRSTRPASARWSGASGCNSANGRSKKVEELSKGMQQKMQFIAALLHDPDLVIMDEPFAGLDPANAVMLKDVLLEMKKAGKTILFSTHRMDQVERLCDAICLVDHGRSVLEGDLKKIKASYGKNHVQMQYEGDPRLEESDLVQVVQQLRQLCRSSSETRGRRSAVIAHGSGPCPHQPVRAAGALAGRDLHRRSGEKCITSGRSFEREYLERVRTKLVPHPHPADARLDGRADPGSRQARANEIGRDATHRYRRQQSRNCRRRAAGTHPANQESPDRRPSRLRPRPKSPTTWKSYLVADR